MSVLSKIVISPQGRPAERYEVHTQQDGKAWQRFQGCPSLKDATGLCATIQKVGLPSDVAVSQESVPAGWDHV